MGNKYTVCALNRDELRAFMQISHFTAPELRGLWFYFKELASSGSGSGERNEDDDHIDSAGFQSALMFRSRLLGPRLFRVFDADADGRINFAEFVACLSSMSTKASPEEKLKLSFNVYDENRDGTISAGELADTLLALMSEQGVVLAPAQAEEVVRRTVREVSSAPESGSISFEDYRRMVAQHPELLSNLSINVSGLIAEFSEANDLVLATPRDATINA